jgi:uncharacterized membrane protein
VQNIFQLINMSKKLLFLLLMPSLVMMGLGLETGIRYSETPGDWHFVVALVGTAVFIVFTWAVVRKFNTQKKVQVSDTTKQN